MVQKLIGLKICSMRSKIRVILVNKAVIRWWLTVFQQSPPVSYFITESLLHENAKKERKCDVVGSKSKLAISTFKVFFQAKDQRSLLRYEVTHK